MKYLPEYTVWGVFSTRNGAFLRVFCTRKEARAFTAPFPGYYRIIKAKMSLDVEK